MRSIVLVSGLLVAVLASAPTVQAGDKATARQALALAALAADSWVDDARLVWIENDDDLDAQGRAESWAFLFYSESLGAMRSWSVRDGRLRSPEDHSVRAAAPGLDPGWLDSSEVIASAHKHAEAPADGVSQLVSLVLVSGVFADHPTWVAVFDRGEGPRLHVVLRARDGDLVRRWRG